MSDGELQKLIAPALCRKLKSAGLVIGTPSDDSTTFFFPININLSGVVSVIRGADGMWVISQETDSVLAERTQASFAAHVEAVTEARMREG